MRPTSTSAAFRTTRLASSTFLIEEYNDIYSEHPFIYVKVAAQANTVLVVDTGCGGASNDTDNHITSLRKYLETVGIDGNGGRPLNEAGKMEYVVVTTHCHYDHILGIEQFKDSLILASSHAPAFLSPSVLPENSLCNMMGVRTPSYKPVLVPHLYAIRSPGHASLPLGILVLHTPGHTPDELSLYDTTENFLYVGDSLYEYEDIIFPSEGSIVAWLSSIDYLVSFVKLQNGPRDQGDGDIVKEVLINAGHRTAVRPALNLLEAAKTFVHDIMRGKETIRARLKVRGEENVVYKQEGGRFSLRCPERLVVEARENHLV